MEDVNLNTSKILWYVCNEISTLHNVLDSDPHFFGPLQNMSPYCMNAAIFLVANQNRCDYMQPEFLIECHVCCSTNPLLCALSSSPIHLRVRLWGILTVSTTFRLPGRRCPACRPCLVLPAPPVSEDLPESAGFSGGLAGELRRRIGGLLPSPFA